MTGVWIDPFWIGTVRRVVLDRRRVAPKPVRLTGHIFDVDDRCIRCNARST